MTDKERGGCAPSRGRSDRGGVVPIADADPVIRDVAEVFELASEFFSSPACEEAGG